ncbi:MAG: serine/threonine protein kinase [Xanthomonadales bacterium]|nr:serine/threonine protein kinase [Xanthomonadales bacterium]
MTLPPPIDAERWARLKEHVADLASLEPTDRVQALDQLALGEDDRACLLRLASPLLADDPRLDGSPPQVRATVEREKLRWREGETIGGYRIETLIGRGGMGEVYEARSLATDQVVALKVLRTGLDQVDYAKFPENEQRALRRLDDPRIAKFVEAFSADEVGTCLVLEWIDGEPLQSYCRDRRYDVNSRLKLFVEVCQAVASAHRQLVIHRDLKPSNVLVTPEGLVKLLDFGVSKLLDDEATDAQPHTHGELFTLDYAAPEQVLNEPVSTATDIYALGGLLFRLLTDVSPYLRAEGASLVKAVLGEPPQRLVPAQERARSSGRCPPQGPLDADLDRVIGRAMQKNPAERYHSVLELAGDIEAILGGRPISGGGSAYYRLSKLVRRHRASAAASIVAFIALVAAGAFGIHESRLTALHAHRADVANHFLLTALDLTDRFSSASSGDPTLGEVLERAVEKARTELADEPNVRATVLGQLGLVLKHRGRTELAQSVISEAYAIRRSDPESTRTELAEIAQELASTEIERGRITDAEKHLQEATDWLGPVDPQVDIHIAILTSKGKLASFKGRIAESLRVYQEIIPLREALPGDHRADVAMDYNNLGTGFYNLSRYREADAAYSRGIALLEARYGAVHPRLGFLQFGRTASLIQLGRFGEAAAMLGRAEQSLGQAGRAGGGPPSPLNTERLRATLDYYAGNYSPALQRLAHALPEIQRSSPVAVAATLTFRGRVELAAGSAQAAEQTLAEAERLYVANDRAGHVQRWVAHGLHGVALAATGNRLIGDAELAAAVDAVSQSGLAGTELLELTLLDGAADRQRGDAASALRKHRQSARERQRLGWLGEFGAAWVTSELLLDAAAPGADAESQELLRSSLMPTIAAWQRMAPKHPLLEPLLALSRVPANDTGRSGRQPTTP